MDSPKRSGLQKRCVRPNEIWRSVGAFVGCGIVIVLLIVIMQKGC